MISTKEAGSGKLWFLHSLRGVAAMLVVIEHLAFGYWFANANLVLVFPFLPAKFNQDYLVFFNLENALARIHVSLGALGVALFFLISGFLIPMSLEKSRGAAFLVNRAFRIYPVYILGFSITFAAIYLACLRTGYAFPYTIGQYLAHLALVRDWFWMPAIDGVSWTLETEIKFYLLAWLAWSTGKFNRAWAVALLALGMAGVNILLHDKYPFLIANEPRLYQLVYILTYSMNNLVFMLLGTCFHYFHSGQWTLKEFAVTIQVVLLAFVLAYLNGPNRDYIAVYSVNYMAALLIFGNLYWIRDAIPYHKALDFLAGISYPLYVVHGVNGYILLSILDGQFHLNPYLAMTLAAGLAILVAWVLHRWVEEPAIALGKRINRALFPPRVEGSGV